MCNLGNLCIFMQNKIFLSRVAGCPLAAKKRKLLDSSSHEFAVSKSRRSEQKRSSSDSSKVCATETEKKSATNSNTPNNNSNNSTNNNNSTQSATNDAKRSEKVGGRKNTQDSPAQPNKSTPLVNGVPSGKSTGKDTVDAKERTPRKTANGANKSNDLYF